MIKNVGEIIDKLFIDSLEPEFRESGHDYLEWAINSVEGDRILDVCSYNGILSVLLRNVNKNTDSVISEKPYPEIIDEIIPSSYGVQEFNDQVLNNPDYIITYDTIIVTDPIRLGMSTEDIARFAPLLNKHGRMIITLKFGKFGSEDGDYGFGLGHLIRNGLAFENARLIGKTIENESFYWLCGIFRRDLSFDKSVNEQLFLTKVRELISEKENDYSNQIQKERARSVETLYRVDLEKERIAKELENIQNNIYLIYNQIFKNNQPFVEEPEMGHNMTSGEDDPLTAFTVEEEVESTYELDASLQIEILRAKLEEATKLLRAELDEEEKLLVKNADLQKRLERSEHRYQALANSTTGKWTLRYWQFLKNKK